MATSERSCGHVFTRRRIHNSTESSLHDDPRFESQPGCRYTLSASDIAVGVLHCALYETARGLPIAMTWGPFSQPSIVHGRSKSGSFILSRPHREKYQTDLSVYMLGSRDLSPSASIFELGSLIPTLEELHDYTSTHSKGLLGLKRMHEANPHAKWYLRLETMFTSTHRSQFAFSLLSTRTTSCAWLMLKLQTIGALSTGARSEYLVSHP